MSNEPLTRWFVSAITAVIVLQVLYGVLVFSLGPDMETRGQFGDIFGGINAFFTGLAFAGLIYTILLQRRELELQREELRQTREELHISAEAQQEQVSELQESAKLNALTALLNVYSTELQPLRDITQDSRRDLATLKARLQSKTLGEHQRESFQADIHELEKRIAD